MLFDTCHLDDRKFQGETDEVIARAKENGVSLIVNVGYNLRHARQSIALAEKYDFLYASVGFILMMPSANDVLWQEITKLAAHPKVVALGEMGLDYYWDNSPRDVQKEVFRHQINMARELKLPIIIHDRDAHQDVLTIVREEKAYEVGGVFHAYSGSWEIAKEVMNLSIYILLWAVTFKNAQNFEWLKRSP